jgi:hypothetical protein
LIIDQSIGSEQTYITLSHYFLLSGKWAGDT